MTNKNICQLHGNIKEVKDVNCVLIFDGTSFRLERLVSSVVQVKQVRVNEKKKSINSNGSNITGSTSTTITKVVSSLGNRKSIKAKKVSSSSASRSVGTPSPGVEVASHDKGSNVLKRKIVDVIDSSDDDDDDDSNELNREIININNVHADNYNDIITEEEVKGHHIDKKQRVEGGVTPGMPPLHNNSNTMMHGSGSTPGSLLSIRPPSRQSPYITSACAPYNNTSISSSPMAMKETASPGHIIKSNINTTAPVPIRPLPITSSISALSPLLQAMPAKTVSDPSIDNNPSHHVQQDDIVNGSTPLLGLDGKPLGLLAHISSSEEGSDDEDDEDDDGY